MIQLNVATGQPVNGASLPGANEQFQWINYSLNAVTIQYCSNWAIPDGCTVPAAQPGPPIQPGVSLIFTVRAHPNMEAGAFSDSGWNAPGMPHVGLSPLNTSKPEEEKEVA